MKKTIIMLAASLLAIACDSHGPSVAQEYVMTEMANDAVAPSPRESLSYENDKTPEVNQTTVSIPADKKKIIRDGTISIRVNDLERAKSDIDSLVKSHNAYYSNESLVNTDSRLTYSLTIRIPSGSFDGFITALEKGKGEITEKYISARDVTTEFIDIETRLASKKEYLERYRELLKQAKSVKEILEIEEQIRALTEEIESSEGRLKYLSDQVSFSTLNLMLNKEKGYSYRPAVRGPFGERFKRAVSGGWNGLVSFALFLSSLWPLWLILGAVIPLWTRSRRKRKHNL